MQRIDIVISAVLLVAALGSAIGIATYEDDRLAQFRVTWSTADEEITLSALTQAGAGDLEATLRVETLNLTRAAWVVTVAGGAARVQGVSIRVEVVSPSNETASADATLPAGPTASVDVPVEVPIATAPTTPSVRAASATAAIQALDATSGSTLGAGDWVVRISLAPSTPGPLGGAETFTVTPRVTFSSYAATVALDTPEVGR